MPGEACPGEGREHGIRVFASISIAGVSTSRFVSEAMNATYPSA
jgi:hypothetical protein